MSYIDTTLSSLPDLDISLFSLIVIGFATFYIIKGIVKSVLKAFLFALSVCIIVFFGGLIYFLGFENTISLLRKTFGL